MGQHFQNQTVSTSLLFLNFSDKTILILIFQGTQRYEGEPVYPQESIDEQDAVFPDGSPLNKHGDQKSLYVFVWKTCGKFSTKILIF